MTSTLRRLSGPLSALYLASNLRLDPARLTSKKARQIPRQHDSKLVSHSLEHRKGKELNTNLWQLLDFGKEEEITIERHM